MPRTINLGHETQMLDRAVQSNTKLLRQYVLRLDPSSAIPLIRDCIKRNRQPGVRLSEIVKEYYSTREQGVHLRFPPVILQALDQAADLTQKTREEVVYTIVRHGVQQLLQLLLRDEYSIDRLLQTAKTRQITNRIKTLPSSLDNFK